MHWFTLLFLIALTTATALQLWLARRQLRHVRRHRERVPEAFTGIVATGEHRRAADYTIDRTRLGTIETVLDTAIVLGWTLGGGLHALDTLWRATGLGPVATGTGFLLSVILAGALLTLPLRAWRTFGIEERYGFNRTGPTLFIADQLRAGTLLLVLGGPLIAVILWFMHSAGTLWWFWAWLTWLAFNLLMVWAWPAFIAPLFNRFEPLDDDELKQRIERLLERCGFRSGGVWVMDGSRRSAHGNAFFSGLGRRRRIVFFDTLLHQLDADQVEAVLAHELGHFRLRHIPRRLATMALLSLAGLALLAWLMEQGWFFSALGVREPSMHAALALFLLVAPVFAFFLQPLFAALSRRDEFQADAFAASHAPPEHLISALQRLYRENAVTVTPDPLHSAFHDSHPPAPVRLAYLQRLAIEQGRPRS